jgi:SAM-dependent methyltransferase
MGILAGVADILCELSVKHRFHGALATLGKQNVIVTPEQWRDVVTRHPACADVALETERHLRWNTEFVSTRCFFRALGFSEVAEIDVSAYEAADHVVDLNAPALPPELHERFDFVFDGSTVEHIFHLPNVLANIFRLLKVGGRVLHMAPSNHFMDDGFYQLSPTFFTDYYAANGFATDCALLHFMTVTVHDAPGAARLDTRDRIVPYDPAHTARVSAAFDTHGDELCQTFFMATKTAEATCGRVPFQSRYAAKDYWREHLAGASGVERGVRA